MADLANRRSLPFKDVGNDIFSDSFGNFREFNGDQKFSFFPLLDSPDRGPGDLKVNIPALAGHIKADVLQSIPDPDRGFATDQKSRSSSAEIRHGS